MNFTENRGWIPYILAIVTILAFLLAWPTAMFTLGFVPAVLFIGLVGFISAVEVPLEGGVFGAGYAAALCSYLVIGNPFETFLILAVGGLMGGLVRAWQYQRRISKRLFINTSFIEWALVNIAHLILTIGITHLAFQAVGGSVPVVRLYSDDIPRLAVLVGTSYVVYVGIWILILFWQRAKPRRTLRFNSINIALTLLVMAPVSIGTALSYNRESPAPFLILIVGLIALIIWSTEMGHGQVKYRQQYTELQSLSAINRMIRTHLDLNSLLITLYEQVSIALETDNVTIVLFDNDQHRIQFPIVVRQGKHTHLLPRDLGYGMIDELIKLRKPILLSGPSLIQALHSNPSDNMGGTVSWLGVPLIVPESVIGGLIVSSDSIDRVFTQRDLEVLNSIGTQASVAIYNAQLYSQLDNRAQQLRSINDSTARISGTLDPQRVLDLVVDQAQKIAVSNGVGLFLWWDDARTSLSLAHSIGLSDSFLADIPMPLCIEQAIPQTIFIRNVIADENASPIRQRLLTENIRSMAELPLRNGEEIMGVLTIYYEQPHVLKDYTLELLQTFVNQSALAISNAQLYGRIDETLSQRDAQLAALADVSKELSAIFDLDRLFDLVLERAMQATNSNSGVLMLRQEVQDKQQIVAMRGTIIAGSDTLSSSYRRAAQSTHTRIDRDGPFPEGVAARLSVPIMRDLEVLGVFVLESPRADAYTADDVSFVTQMAAQAAIAFDNARMVEWMQESRNRLQVILDSMQEAVIMIDAENHIAMANPRVASLLTLPVDRLIGAHLLRLLEQPDLHLAEKLGFEPQELRNLSRNLHQQIEVNSRINFQLEQRFIDRTILPITNAQRIVGYLLVFTDVTEERQLMQAREDLSSMIVHDLRGPLTAIRASMKLLSDTAKDDTPLAQSIRKTTDVSQRALRKLLSLVNSLLDIAKMESGKMVLEQETHTIQPLVDSVMIELSPLAEEVDVQIINEVPANLPSLLIDVEKVERILLNLVDNALKFVPYEGNVKVHGSIFDERFVCIRVIDNGPGIPDNFKTKIFDRFQQVDGQSSGNRRGTGLGLTFCRLTVEAHGGKIWIEDNPGGGSIFAFTLPMAALMEV